MKKTKFFQNQKSKIIVKSNQNEDLEFYAALVSLDEEFMNWVKLRLGYFEDLFESKESSTLDSYVSDGVFGNFLIEESIVKTKNVLASKSSFVHPDIISSKLVDSIKSFY